MNLCLKVISFKENFHIFKTETVLVITTKVAVESPNFIIILPCLVLVESKSFWSSPNHFGHVQIRLFWTNFYNLDLSKMIWTQPK